MADMPPGMAPPQAPGAPQGAPGQPSFGSAPAPAQVPNQGQTNSGIQILAVIQQAMLMALAQIGASSPAGVDVLSALRLIGKHIPPGAVSPAAANNAIMSIQQRMQQQNPQIAQMQAMAARQQAGGAQPQPAAA